MSVLRLQNTCVRKFFTGIRDSPFMSYWKAQEAAACTVVSIDFYLLGATDYDVLDSIVNHLRPRTTGFSITVNSSRPEYLALLVRDSFLNNLQTCRLDVNFRKCVPTPAFFLEEPGYPNYKVKCWRRCGQLADGIDGFIESFVRDGCPNKKLESVCIQWIDDEGPPSTAPKQLSKPTKSDMNLPENGLSGFITRMDHHVVQCEMYSFVNERQCKRMDVYKWSVGYNDGYGRRTAHLLQCRLENL
ncbi:hypothetical protein AAVH_37827 [Aphelenchoides avenae]|nr:hypothetical protein AAVH_37827 [Aphelenchus avenae]